MTSYIFEKGKDIRQESMLSFSGRCQAFVGRCHDIRIGPCND